MRAVIKWVPAVVISAAIGMQFGRPGCSQIDDRRAASG
jgi:hypothetical protein